MCVVAICQKKRIPHDEFLEAFRCNDDGVGMAWRTNGTIRYIKGLMKDKEAWETYKTNVPEDAFPHIVHFRKGTPKCPDLTHPFLCTEESEIILNYEGKDSVLFHNGVVMNWKTTLLNIFVKYGKTIDGEWSDTRMVAMLVHLLSEKALEFVDGKYVIFGTDIAKYYGDWCKEEAGIIWSNRSYVLTRTGCYTGGLIHQDTAVTNVYNRPQAPSIHPALTANIKKERKKIEYGHLSTVEDLENGLEFLI